jgi:cation diffusion facilitator CzcD-associated flavoprotein CzcO
MGIKLKEAGYHNFLILERADEVGGTWRDNDYPGCACDIPSHLYSFSFATKPDWSRMFPWQWEIKEYLQSCVDSYKLGRHLEFGRNVVEARFDEANRRWTVTTKGGGSYRCRVLVSGMGGLSRPSTADIPGLEKFRGELFHSAQWNHRFELRGKRVAVVGTGASAIQFVPRIVDRVEKLYLYQRTPPWIVPKLDRSMKSWEKWCFRQLPFTNYLLRNFIYWRQEVRGMGFTIDPRLMRRARTIALRHLQESIANKTLRKILTPDYTIGCKRILISNDYYPALLKSNLHLRAGGIADVDATGVTGDNGAHVEVDAIILATGFHATDPLTPTRIFGIGGRELADDWRDGPQAYLGINVSGYPNLFLLMGPNTGLGHNSMVFMIEAQVRYTVSLLHLLLATDNASLEVRTTAQQDFNNELQQALKKTVWSSGCKSWYQAGSGRHSVLWPGFTFSYWLRTRRPNMQHYIKQ